MKLALIVDPYGEEKPGGLGRAIFQMAQGIINSHVADVTVYFKKKNASTFVGSYDTQVLGVNRLWFSAGKKLSKKHDLYIFFTPIIPLTFFPKKSIVVVHDLAYLELPAKSLKERLSRLVLKQLHRIALVKATKIVAVSETAKRSTISHLGISPHKIQVIYNGFIPLPLGERVENLPEKFFLFAGVLKERKNVHGVIRSFAVFAQTNTDYMLLIAGKTGSAYAESAQKLAEDLNIKDRVRFVGYVRDGELRYLYSKALALVFPSFIEGFGMPVLEAMDIGLPVITSNTGALAEVAGNAALLVNPHNESDIARAMLQMAEDQHLRDMYIEKGKKRAAEFSWSKNTQEFSKLIQSI
jgi:glycosyltransferase involved in cell wall biosynthesis